ncbi:FAST kinase domain-containing protein 2, mitochondrial [Brienomyrus brachyistius]|uniref:FAST kinase domain-containing protein 2, mitochondrial n=1 Tax=Brienomyrus brachyistius TaxID=42636 RepID=UPI0020B38F8A|nr:FAST kinase domain-containing protein 2, mitochondrial [Brienomyrus brachyistius]
MTLCESGNMLFRGALLLCRRSSLWRHFAYQAPGGERRLHESCTNRRVPGLWNVHHDCKLYPRTYISMVRFYSRDDTWVSPENSGDSTKIQTLPSISLDAPYEQPVLEEPVTGVRNEVTDQQLSYHEKLLACRSPVDVLDLSGRYTMTLRRSCSTLGRVWEAFKVMPENQRSYQLQLVYEHPAFQDLCLRIMRDAPKMKQSDVAYCLLALVRLGVPQRSRVVQTLLRVTQERLNEFNEKSLSVLASCLENMQSCRNVDALKEALRLLISDRAPTIRSVMALQSLMRCVGRELPARLKKSLEEKAISMADQFTLPNAQYMFITLASINFFSKPLLDICRNKLIESIHCVPFGRLLQVLKACAALGYRDHRMLSAIAEYLESTFGVWTSKQLVLFLLAFEEMGFRPASLMDMVAEKVIQDPSTFTQKNLMAILKTYSSLSHLPQHHRREFLDSVTSLLESYLPRMTHVELLKAVFFLCVLGHFPPTPLEKLLREDALHELVSGDGDHLWANRQKLHYIDLCLRLDHPSSPIKVPAGSLTLHPTQPTPPASAVLMEMLQNIVGEEAVQEAVLLENGYFLDCVITPPPRTPEPVGVSDESSAPEPRRSLAVLNVHASSFCLASRHPRGLLAVKLRHLKALGSLPVLVHHEEFETLPYEEKEQLLRSLIFGVTEGDQSGHSVRASEGAGA